MQSKNYSLLKLLPLIAIFMLNSCGKRYSIEQADKAYENKQFALAAQMYDGIYKDKKTDKGIKSEIAFKSGEAYRNFESYDKALRSYDKALDRDKNNAQALYMKGVVLQNQGKYKDAIKVFNKYLVLYPGDKDALAKKKGCELALGWKDDCTRYNVENFKIANSKENDYAPMSADKRDKTMFFTSDRNPNPKKRERLYTWTGNGFSEIWAMSEQKSRRRRKSSSANTEKKWDKPTVLDAPPNTKANDGTVCFDRRFSTMYFTICNGGDNKSAACKIYKSRRIGQAWGEPEILAFCEADSASSYGQPTLSPDGNKLYFSSNREGGYGGHDIWVVNYVRRGRTWSEPVNLGETVNTSKNEMFPYFNQHDGKLYFSSNGHPGFGGLDMFNTEGSGEEWSAPENLSIPMNSGGDDFGITFDNMNQLHGFFSSNRDGGRGGDDIYEFYKIPPIIDVKGVVIDSTTKEPLPGSLVTITWNDTNKIEIITDAQGSYFAELEENKIYTIQASNDTNYYFPSKRIAVVNTFKLKCDTHFVEDFQLKSMIEVWELPIFYDLDKAFIRPDAAEVLDKFSKEILLEYPRIVIEMGSHTDCRSSYAYNMDLSRRRADSAVAYLVSKGIMKERLFAKGYGESQLTNHCKCEGTEVVPCSEAEHQKNRRTTIKIVNFNFDPRNKKVIGGDPLNTNDGNGNDSAYIADSAMLAAEKRMKDSAMAVLQKQEAKAKKLDSLSIKMKITEADGKKTVPVKINEKVDVQFAWDLRASRNVIPITLAAEWLNSGVINKGNFSDGDKIKAPDGTKLPSNKIYIDIFDIGGYLIKRVPFYIMGEETAPTFGKSVFRKFDLTKVREEDGMLKLLPKRR